MRLAIDPRQWRLFRRLPRYSLLSLTEILLLALLAWQCARLVWAVVTPLGPLGDWRPVQGPDAARGRAVLASGFDPFFRLGRAAGPAIVTSLQLKLFGVRVDEATGRGSAIIAGPDNVQTSYAVGEAIQPGVTLKSVGYDSVVISRGGADETLYLDQSGAAPVAAAPIVPPAANTGLLSAPAGQTMAPGAVTLSELQAQLNLAPRQAGNRVTGLVPRGDPALLARLGLRPGDVIVQVSGRPIGSVQDLQRAAAGLAQGGNLSIAVERGAQIVPIAVAISGQ
ncbi:PDZ domain-containing protein [Sphingomonas sp. ID1715]|uniref:type II secretion system protein N n=1 Tax=Sphingomonas sp. ID1715 TaxID=1656898 RepID=UPI001489E7BB|nr:type II secretion system protein N [Sphingomonas sp. ID1715]NNM77909.1 PDZ domain-containing protein [Sphingomonas sp. ID1715]